MEDTDTLDMQDIMDTPMPTTDYTLASVLLMLSLRPRLMLTPTFSMEDTDTLDMQDIMDTPMPDMDMDILDMPDITDIPMVDMPTWDKLQSPKQYPATENGQNNHQCLFLQ